MKLILRIQNALTVVETHCYAAPAGTREDTKILAKIISGHGNTCSSMEVSVTEG